MLKSQVRYIVQQQYFQKGHIAMGLRRRLLVKQSSKDLQVQKICEISFCQVFLYRRVFKYYIRALEGSVGLTKNADAADALRELGGLRSKLMM